MLPSSARFFTPTTDDRVAAYVYDVVNELGFFCVFYPMKTNTFGCEGTRVAREKVTSCQVDAMQCSGHLSDADHFLCHMKPSWRNPFHPHPNGSVVLNFCSVVNVNRSHRLSEGFENGVACAERRWNLPTVRRPAIGRAKQFVVYQPVKNVMATFGH